MERFDVDDRERPWVGDVEGSPQDLVEPDGPPPQPPAQPLPSVLELDGQRQLLRSLAIAADDVGGFQTELDEDRRLVEV